MIDRAPQGIKDMFIKDKELTALLESAFLAGREDVRVEIVEYLMRSHKVDNKIIENSQS